MTTPDVFELRILRAKCVGTVDALRELARVEPSADLRAEIANDYHAVRARLKDLLGAMAVHLPPELNIYGQEGNRWCQNSPTDLAAFNQQLINIIDVLLEPNHDSRDHH